FQRAALLSYFSRSPQANRSARACARVPFPGSDRAPPQTSSDPSLAPSQDFPGGKGCEEGRQTLRLCTECIAVPEVLFRPQDVGSTECGIVELVQRSVSLLPREFQPFACGEILLVGGTAKFPGMRERLWKDLRSILPQHWPINIYMEDDPQFSVWRGASFSYSDRALFNLNALTRQQFEESGNAKGQAANAIFE
ncbi:actin-like protein alp 5, partial [Cystoisospora suis]